MKVFVYYLGAGAAQQVGVLADDPRTGRIFFEYSQDWSRRHRELSPMHLPNRLSGASSHANAAFLGLFGLFHDSLPDRWGMKIAEKRFQHIGRRWESVTPLELLCYRGRRCVGALAYEPDTGDSGAHEVLDVRQIAEEARVIEEGHAETVLPELERAGGSAGGMRPKAVIGLHDTDETVLCGVDDLPEGYAHWLVKFDTQPEREYGRVEWAFSLMARDAGIDFPETRLLYSKDDKGRKQAHFAIRRFDRGTSNRRSHIHTFGGIAHRDFNQLDVDYNELLTLTRSLTSDQRSVTEMFRRCVFNVFAGNGDDHAKNHSFLMHDTGMWTLSPAYDITWARLKSGKRSTGVMGDFSFSPELTKIYELAEEHEVGNAKEIIGQVLSVTAEWRSYAAKAGLSTAATELYANRLEEIRQDEGIRL